MATFHFHHQRQHQSSSSNTTPRYNLLTSWPLPSAFPGTGQFGLPRQVALDMMQDQTAAALPCAPTFHTTSQLSGQAAPDITRLSRTHLACARHTAELRLA